MRTGTDDRGVSAVLGAILLFGIAIALLVLLDLTVVPEAVYDDEVSHNERVQADLRELAAEVGAVALAGADRTVTVEVADGGLFDADTPTGGTLETEPASFSLANVTAAGDAGEFWTGTEAVVESRHVVFRPDYDEYAAAPVTRYEGWATYNDYGGTHAFVDWGSVVQGRRIDLVAITGDVRLSSGLAPPVDVYPVSSPPRSLTVTNSSTGPITLTLDTHLPVSAWERGLADELAPDGNVVSVEPAGDGRVRIVLAAGTYDLRMARVHLGTAPEAERPRYVATVEDTGSTLEGGETYTVSIEVRDRFNNPVGGRAVGSLVAGVPSAGTVHVAGDPSTNATVPDGDGRATFVYVAPPDVPEAEDVTFVVDATGVDGPAGEVEVTVGLRPRGDFTIENGSVVPNRPFTATVELIGSAITYGDGPRVDVGVEVTVGANATEPWPDNVNDDSNPRYYTVTNRPAGTPVSVTATSEVMSVASTVDGDFVYVLRDGDPVPDVEGYLDQADAEAYVQRFIDPATDTVVLEPNQAIFLFELGTTDLSSPAADFQDAVVVVNLYYE